MPSSHYLSYPVPAAHELWADCDLCIAIGSHARMPLLKWGHDNDLKFLSINIDPDVHHRMKQADVAITGDSKEVLQALNNQMKDVIDPRPSIEEKMDDFAKAGKLRPRDGGMAALAEARAALKAGELKRASTAADASLQANDANMDAFYVRGICAVRQKDYEKGKSDLLIIAANSGLKPNL